MKGTFFVQHLMSHALPGIQIQVLFTGLAANVVLWCRPWLKDCSDHLTLKWERTLNSPKNLVQVAANCSAQVQQTPCGTALQFMPDRYSHSDLKKLRSVFSLFLVIFLEQRLGLTKTLPLGVIFSSVKAEEKISSNLAC